jgi:mono/diheme cytochrome c family protein
MNRVIVFILLLGTVAGQFITSCTNTSGADNYIPGADSKTSVTADSVTMVKRGEYLVSTVGCDDCHSPKRMGAQGPEIIPELRLSGFPEKGKLPPADSNVVKLGWALMAPDLTAAVGPWGISFAANITSDPTGIGNWKEENFVYALRHGKLKGLEMSRNILPPMPWFVYKNMTDDDLKSIFAYLKTTAPVKNIVPAPKPFSQLK